MVFPVDENGPIKVDFILELLNAGSQASLPPGEINIGNKC
jgi:hypothetical protein